MFCTNYDWLYIDWLKCLSAGTAEGISRLDGCQDRFRSLPQSHQLAFMVKMRAHALPHLPSLPGKPTDEKGAVKKLERYFPTKP